MQRRGVPGAGGCARFSGVWCSRQGFVKENDGGAEYTRSVENLTDPVVGRTLDGRYSVSQRLARGGMATVYLATDLRLDRQVAVKVMHPHLGEDPSFQARFHREARTVARITHPGIVSVFDQGTDGHLTYLAMEYVPGTTLREVIARNAPLSLSDSLNTCEQVLDALDAAHTAGLVHRDIKPENVLVGTNGKTKVADFGLARAAESTRPGNVPGNASTTAMMGTIAYVAPEIVNEQGADSRSDVYAVGVMLYEMLTGEQPFTGEPIVVARKHLEADFPLPSEKVQGIPPEIDELVLWATAKDPADRPENAREMLEELRDIRTDLDPTALNAGSSALSADVTPKLEDAPTLPHQAFPNATAMLPRDHQQLGRMAPVHEEPEPVYQPPAQQSAAAARPGRIVAATLVSVLLACLVAGFIVWYSLLGPGAYTTAPNVDDKPQEEAQSLLQTNGFSVDTEEAWDELVPMGHVVETKPEAGGHVRKGATITLVISKGSAEVSAPNLVGQSVDQARSMLESVDLKLGNITKEYSKTTAKNTIMSQTIPAGNTATRGDTVDVVVSQGARPVTIPDVVELDQGSATSQLQQAGLLVKVQNQYSDDVAEGFVLSQDPGSGEGLEGQTVTIVVSNGPETKEVTVPDVRGKSVKDAEKQLKDAGFQVTVIGFNFDSAQVQRMNPAPGTTVEEGASISIWTF